MAGGKCKALASGAKIGQNGPGRTAHPENFAENCCEE
jgi:hypothetical protein